MCPWCIGLAVFSSFSLVVKNTISHSFGKGGFVVWTHLQWVRNDSLYPGWRPDCMAGATPFIVWTHYYWVRNDSLCPGLRSDCMAGATLFW